LAFILGQFIALFAWTNIGAWLAVTGAEFLQAIGLTGYPAILGFVVLASLLNLFVVSGSSLWTLMASVFVPMFLLLGYEPAFIQGAFRVGDAATQVVTPLNPYMIVLLTFVRRYQPEAGLGTVIAKMVPFVVPFWVAWVLVLTVFYAFGIPLGPGVGVRLAPCPVSAGLNGRWAPAPAAGPTPPPPATPARPRGGRGPPARPPRRGRRRTRRPPARRAPAAPGSRRGAARWRPPPAPPPAAARRRRRPGRGRHPSAPRPGRASGPARRPRRRPVARREPGPDRLQQQHIGEVDHRGVGGRAVLAPHRPAVEAGEGGAAGGHVGERADPHEPVRVADVAERADDAGAELLLRLDELPLEQLDQLVPAARVQGVLPQLDDRHRRSVGPGSDRSAAREDPVGQPAERLGDPRGRHAARALEAEHLRRQRREQHVHHGVRVFCARLHQQRPHVRAPKPVGAHLEPGR